MRSTFAIFSALCLSCLTVPPILASTSSGSESAVSAGVDIKQAQGLDHAEISESSELEDGCFDRYLIVIRQGSDSAAREVRRVPLYPSCVDRPTDVELTRKDDLLVVVVADASESSGFFQIRYEIRLGAKLEFVIQRILLEQQRQVQGELANYEFEFVPKLGEVIIRNEDCPTRVVKARLEARDLQMDAEDPFFVDRLIPPSDSMPRCR
jgi:hypothetical protein